MYTIIPYSWCCHRAQPIAHLIAKALSDKGYTANVPCARTNVRGTSMHLKGSPFENTLKDGQSVISIKNEQTGYICWLPSTDYLNWQNYLKE